MHVRGRLLCVPQVTTTLPPVDSKARPAAGPAHDHRIRIVGWIVVGAALGLLVARVLAIQGLLAPIEIDGSSMAPSLFGEHREVRCPDCSFAWKCEPFAENAAPRMTCPNCGSKLGDHVSARSIGPDHVWIDRATYLTMGPVRGDLVAVKIPGESDKFAVKRIAALPGEAWSISRGDLMIDGKLAAKSLDQFLESAVIVNDDAFRPLSLEGKSRWRPVEMNSAWQTTSQGHTWQSGSTNTGNLLRYVNWACVETATMRQAAKPIRDVDPFNVSLARVLNDVHDIAVTMDVALTDKATLRISIWRDSDRKEIVSLSSDQQSQDACILLAGKHRVVLGVIDGRLLLSIDGHARLPILGKSPDELSVDAAQPICLVALGEGTITVENIRVLRDIYLLDADGLSRTQSTENNLGSDEYAVLGDNPPTSIDSRQWPKPIRRQDILGRVIPRRGPDTSDKP
jgi:signal peptidase I